MKPIFLILGVLFLFASCAPDKDKQTVKIIFTPDPGNGGITLPDQFGAVVVVDSLGRGRHLVVNENGDIYAHLRAPNDEGNAIIALRDTTNDGRADVLSGFSSFKGTGIEIHNGHLYYATQTRIYRSPLVDGELLPGEHIDTIAHVVADRGHVEKTFAFDGKGNMYVNVGSLSNACEQPLRTGNSPGEDPCTELLMRGGIWKFNDSIAAQEQTENNRYATGIRNAVALTWNENAQSLYAVGHGRDDLHRYWPEKFTEAQNVELPSEEFFQIGEGDDFGWPYCYWDHMAQQKVLNPEYGGDGTAIGRCADAKAPIMGFPGHWGPNDMLFYTGDQFPERYKNGAFIAFHGSWNRLNHDQDGYRVVFVPMENGKPSGPYEDFATGFLGADPITSPGDAKYRPCGLAQGPDGSLYIIDSQKGKIWRIMYYEDGLPKVDAVVAQDSLENGSNEVAEILFPEGKAVYDQHCRACHQASGEGVSGMIPTLHGTEWVNGDKTTLINIVLNGFNEEIEINGENYQNAMGAMDYLTDQEIADVLSFVRNNFGNASGQVTADDVAAVRSE